MKELILKLEEDKRTHQVEVNYLTRAILALQRVCNHDYEFLSGSHNGKIYKCSICGKTEEQ